MNDYPITYRVFDRTRRGLPPPGDMRSLVVQADPKWAKDSVQPITYVFSNRRAFSTTQQPGQPYSWL
jgi:hypothetical protein